MLHKAIKRKDKNQIRKIINKPIRKIIHLQDRTYQKQTCHLVLVKVVKVVKVVEVVEVVASHQTIHLNKTQ